MCVVQMMTPIIGKSRARDRALPSILGRGGVHDFRSMRKLRFLLNWSQSLVFTRNSRG